MPSHLVSRRLTRTASALTLALGVGLAGPIALATTAGAATPPATASVSDNGPELLYTAASGQTNKVTVNESYASGSTDITYVIDDIVPITAGTGCAYPDSADHTKVSCTVATQESQDPYSTLKMDLADGDDSVTVDSTVYYYTNDIYLGAGTDKLTETGTTVNYIWGQAGADTITVGPDAVVSSGDDNDTVYAGDNAIVNGGKGNDVIHGGTGAQSLSGGDGNDTIYGGTNNDMLYGGKGNDVLYGNSGSDWLYGNSGNDKLYGGPSKDTLSGGPGTDLVRQD